ncbi:MAG: malto-oligosyltrehalose synthase [Burkholderiaceae bacterium]|nr:malto-oligosyltrehalose synthase [Burkholderiaceae bacterium]
MSGPRATARLQFHKGFTLDDAADLVDYYAALGISHIYASPLTVARPGSMHGYDVIDPTRINPELGGEPALRRLVARLRKAGMGLILDIVPNHMAIAGACNPWWQDVLRWGERSHFAQWFDIDWQVDDAALRGKVLAPFLARPYGEALAAGEIVLRFDAKKGELYFSCYGERFPLAISDYPKVLLATRSSAFEPVVAAFELIVPEDTADEEYLHADVAFAGLQTYGQSESGLADVAACLAHFEPDSSAGRKKLHQLLEDQHYRLAWWRTAAEEINWRRFFEIAELAGVRVEREEVFEATHKMIRRLYAEGLIDGVRIDHIDGLADPRAYGHRLRAYLTHSMPDRHPALRQRPYIIAEKILSNNERLREDWMFDGTTGYDFMDQVGALLHDPAGKEPLDRLWCSFSSGVDDFGAEVRTIRHHLLAENFVGELNTEIRTLHQIARSDLTTRDMSFAAIRRVLTALLAGFPVYRTYIDETAGPIDERILFQAAEDARRNLRAADYPELATIIRWLAGEVPEAPRDPGCAALRKKAIRRFQQLTPPLAAKSVEDTAFYRYGRLLSRNEVGSDPEQFSIEPLEFHIACGARLSHFPQSMIATATHDHKRGEDSRARLAVLSEIPHEWEQAVSHWRMANAAFRKEILSQEGTRVLGAPAPWDEYMLYQALVGAWPIDLRADDEEGIRAFAQRLDQWQAKALHEAKRMSDWTQPNEEYESACRQFLFGILDTESNRHFLAELAMWLQKIFAAGAVNSFSQTLLRLSSPGVPDLYQGTEFWDFSLVDPDNRRPVDHAGRKASLQERFSIDDGLKHWENGRIKQHIVRSALALRRQFPTLFSLGDYVSLTVEGPLRNHVVAFSRSHEGKHMFAIATRLSVPLLDSISCPVISAQKWEGNTITLPQEMDGVWTEIFTGKQLSIKNGSLSLTDALADFSIALFHNA